MSKKKPKSEVEYTDKAAKHSERCELCRYFRPLWDSCTKVEGYIAAEGWCKLFEKRR